MIFKVEKASDLNFEKDVEINSLEELMKFIDDNGEIILNKDNIIIYDDYVE